MSCFYHHCIVTFPSTSPACSSLSLDMTCDKYSAWMPLPWPSFRTTLRSLTSISCAAAKLWKWPHEYIHDPSWFPFSGLKDAKEWRCKLAILLSYFGCFRDFGHLSHYLRLIYLHLLSFNDFISAVYSTDRLFNVPTHSFNEFLLCSSLISPHPHFLCFLRGFVYTCFHSYMFFFFFSIPASLSSLIHLLWNYRKRQTGQ